MKVFTTSQKVGVKYQHTRLNKSFKEVVKIIIIKNSRIVYNTDI